MVMKEYPAIRYQPDGIQRYMDHVIREERFRLYLNNEPLAVQIASPEQLRELGAGFVVTEGIAREVDAVSVTGDEIWIDATVEDDEREIEWRTCGGSGIRKIPGIVHSSLKIAPSEVFRVTEKIESEVWRMTGGVHCSVLFSGGELIAKSCDIGRHNTVDKVVGHAVLSGVDRGRCYLGCTGRQPAGMVSKSANAGIPIVISRAASTDRGIITARDAGLTLICFSRQKRFTVYSHPGRIEGLEHYAEEGEEDQ